MIQGGKMDGQAGIVDGRRGMVEGGRGGGGACLYCGSAQQQELGCVPPRLYTSYPAQRHIAAFEVRLHHRCNRHDLHRGITSCLALTIVQRQIS